MITNRRIKEYYCSECGANRFVPQTKILGLWFDSFLFTFNTLENATHYVLKNMKPEPTKKRSYPKPIYHYIPDDN